MKTFSTQRILAFFGIASIVGSGICQPAVLNGQEAVENNRMRVELIGLKQWTVRMIQDSLAVHAPNDSLLSHTCAETLVDRLRFADATVSVYPPGSGRLKELVVLTVIEPQDSALVRLLPRLSDSLSLRSDWAEAYNVRKNDREAFEAALQTPAFWRDGDSAVASRIGATAALPLKQFLKVHSTSKDLFNAVWTLGHDNNPSNRIVAAVLLRNFSNRDVAWRALMSALRDSNWPVARTAMVTLHGMRQSAPRRIGWSPILKDLRLLVNGTALPANNEVLSVLSWSQVDPAIGRAILRGKGQIVVAKLGSSAQPEREAAHAFLKQVSGKSWDANSSNWKRWVRGL